MKKNVIAAMTHISCGQPVTWRHGTEDKPGGPYCAPCATDVPREELSNPSAVLCVVDAHVSA